MVWLWPAARGPAVITLKPCLGFQRALDCLNDPTWVCDTRTLPGAKYTLEFAVNRRQ